MSEGNIIPNVSDSKQKQQNYQKLMDKYADAMANGYYAEAELIVYAFMEDRLRSLLFYMGAMKTWNAKWLTDEAAMIAGQVSSINDISIKTGIILKIINKMNAQKTESEFIDNLKKKLPMSEAKRLKTAIKGIDSWRKYRNEIVHALFNKDLNEINAGFKQHVEEGFELAREVDRYAKMLKKA